MNANAIDSVREHIAAAAGTDVANCGRLGQHPRLLLRVADMVDAYRRNRLCLSCLRVLASSAPAVADHIRGR